MKSASSVYKKPEGRVFAALTEKAEIGELKGVKYPLEAYEMTMGYPIGVSNEITADRAVLRINSGIVLVIESKK